jgi:L-iditol 2-dehydrogenase
LDKALELGATRVMNAKEYDIIEEFKKITNGEGAEIVFETAGVVQTTQQTPYVVKKGGTIILVGMAPQDVFEFNFTKIMSEVAQIKPLFRFKNVFPTAVKAVSSGLIDVSNFISHEFTFNEIENAFNTIMLGENDIIKAVIKID